MQFIVEHFGQGVFKQFIIVLAANLEVFTSTYLFNLKGKYKRRFALYNLILIACVLLLTLPLAILRERLSSVRVWQGIFHTIYMLLLTMLLLFVTYKQTPFQFIQTLCAIHATRMFAARSMGALLNLCGKDSTITISFFAKPNDTLDWTIYGLYHLAIYILFGFVFKEKEDVVLEKKAKISIIVLTLVSLLVTDISYCFVTPYEGESLRLSGVLKMIISIIALLILFLRMGIIYRSRKEIEIDVVNQLLVSERDQFEKSRESIDYINAKCHDLKHQLGNLQGKITDEELKCLKEATEIYDSTIKTGNSRLDAVLYEHQLVCQKKGIKLHCMADGSLLSFMDNADLYAIMQNALSNAIRAVEELEDDKKIIDFTLVKKNGVILFEMDNYYQGDIAFDKEGIPFSTKGDLKNHYGTRSISYLVNQYKGTVRFEAENSIFRLLIAF